MFEEKRRLTGLRPWLQQRYWLIALTAITLLGAALRLADLNNLPPGEDYDEALFNLFARNAVASGQFQVFYGEIGGGYHPAIVYTAMLWRWLTGNNPLAARYGVAVFSALAVPFIFFALRAIFELDEPRPRATALALLGTLIAAITLPYVIISRTGAEMTLTIAPAALTFWFLALGLRTGRRRHFALAGAALGLSLYTYYSARLLPVAIALALAWIALASKGGRSAWRARALDLLVVAGACLVVVLPLAAYFALHPYFFVQRALDTTAGVRGAGLAGLPAVLANSTLRTLGGLVLPGFGDVLPQHNLPGQPLFDAFLALCLALGVVIALAGAKRRSRVLLLSWGAILLVPTIVTMSNNSPHFTRLIAGLPALAGLAALGLVALYDTMSTHSRWLAVGVAGLGLAFSLSATVVDYFVRWPNTLAVIEDFKVADWRAANLALARSPSQHVFLSPELISNDVEHPSFDLLLRAGPVRDFPGPDCLVYRDRPDQPLSYIVLVPSDPRTIDRLAALFPTGRQEQQAILHAPNEWADYLIYDVPAGAVAAAPRARTNAVFGGAVGLVGYDLSQTSARPGETIKVTLYWQGLAAPLATYNMFVHLYLPGGDVGAPGVSPRPVAQSDGAPCGQKFLTTLWAAGEIVVDERALTVPAGYPAATAALGVGVYAWPSLERLPVAGLAAPSVLPGDRVSLGTIKVVR